MTKFEKAKHNKKQEIRWEYDKTLLKGNTFVVNGTTYHLTNGIPTLQGLTFALNSALAQASETVRFSDNNGIHITPVADLSELVKEATIWGDAQWNRKADRYQELDAVTVDSYSTEAEAITALNAVCW